MFFQRVWFDLRIVAMLWYLQIQRLVRNNGLMREAITTLLGPFTPHVSIGYIMLPLLIVPPISSLVSIHLNFLGTYIIKWILVKVAIVLLTN